MKCKNHIENDSSYACIVCGEPLCSECAVELGKKVYCRECLEELIQQKALNPKEGRKHKKIWWLALILSIVPGTGHMYLGLVKKGVALMSLLFSLIFVVILFSDNSAWLAGFLIPTLSFLFLSYSIFDCLSLADRVNSGADLHDEGIYELRLLKELILRKKGLFSLLLAGAGIIGIVNISLNLVDKMNPGTLAAGFPVTGLALCLLLIIAGILLLKEGRGGRYH